MTGQVGFAIDLDIKAVSEDGEFEGHAAWFGNVDAMRDIIVPGAFAKSLAARPASKVKLLRQHDPSEPIGVVLSLAEDGRGLKFKARIITETTKGRETLSLMRAGALDKMSIGFHTVRDRFDRQKSARILEEIDLHEISVVTFAANPQASISRVKHDPDEALAFVAAIDRARAALRV